MLVAPGEVEAEIDRERVCGVDGDVLDSDRSEIAEDHVSRFREQRTSDLCISWHIRKKKKKNCKQMLDSS